MKDTPRYYATGLADVVAAQGRRRDWLASEIGVHRSFITHIAAGRRTVDHQTASKIASVLQVPFFLIFDLSPDKTLSPSVDLDAERFDELMAVS